MDGPNTNQKAEKKINVEAAAHEIDSILKWCNMLVVINIEAFI